MALTVAGRAELLVYDNFDGNGAGNLIGQTTTGVGLTGKYTAGGTTVGQSLTVADGGLAFSSLSSGDGKSVTATSSGSGFTSSVALALDNAFTGTLYTSYLINFSSLSLGAGLAEVRVHNDAGGNGTTARFRLEVDASGANAIQSGVGYNETPGASSTDALQLNITYLVIGRFTNVNTALSSSTTGAADLFVMTAAQYDDFMAAGGTDAYLNSATVAGGQLSARASDSIVQTGAFTFANGDFLQVGVGGSSNGSETFRYDEIRYGTELTDVVAVPEPVNPALILSGAALLWGARRRRKG